MCPFRLPAGRKFQADFFPPSRHLRNDPYDNQDGEVEYEDAGLGREEYETRFEMIRAERLWKQRRAGEKMEEMK